MQCTFQPMVPALGRQPVFTEGRPGYTLPMFPLVLATIFATGFGLGIRAAQGFGANLTAVGAVNYLTATLLNLCLALIAGNHAPGPLAFAIGVPAGITYSTAFFVVFLVTRYRGAAVSGAVCRLSTVIPAAVALAIWGERLNSWQAAGAAFALVSLPLLCFRGGSVAAVVAPAPVASGPVPPDDSSAGARRGGWLVLILFVINGICLLVTQTWKQMGIAGQDSSFLTVVFAAASLTAWTVLILQRRGIRWLDVACGVAIGASNGLCGIFMIKALNVLPGTVAYPFYSAFGLVLTVIGARLAWRERFGRFGAMGIALAGIAVVLVNLGSA